MLGESAAQNEGGRRTCDVAYDEGSTNSPPFLPKKGCQKRARAEVFKHDFRDKTHQHFERVKDNLIHDSDR